ncbi:MAG: phage minor head protein [Pseudomonadota bacterium]
MQCCSRTIPEINRQRPRVPVIIAAGPFQLSQSGSLCGEFGSPRRLKLIYRQNMQTAYMAGRYKQQQELANATGPGARPYWQYIAVRDSRTRPTHSALHGRVWRADDPIWNHLYPPNGWNCRCRVRALSEFRMKKEGLQAESSDGQLVTMQVSAGKLPNGKPDLREVTGIRIIDRDGKPAVMLPDAGWSYNPGRAWYDPFTPEMLDGPPPTMPLRPGMACLSSGCTPPGKPHEPRIFDSALLLPKGRDDAYYIAAFLEMFGMQYNEANPENRMFTDKVNEQLLIGMALFIDREKTAKAGAPVYKLAKDEQRRTHMRMLAQTIIDPQEIWQALEVMKAKAREGEIIERRRYLGWWLVDGQDRPGLASFEYAPEAYWVGRTVFAPHEKEAESALEYMERQRTGRRVWPKDE